MPTRISAILIKESPTLGWKASKKKTAQENLIEVLERFTKIAEILRERNLPADEHLSLKENLKVALREVGISLGAVPILLKSATDKKAAKKSKELAEKSHVQLIRELLRLAQSETRLRNQSSDYGEAWPEVEADFFTKMSLYQMELNRR